MMVSSLKMVMIYKKKLDNLEIQTYFYKRHLSYGWASHLEENMAWQNDLVYLDSLLFSEQSAI